uniref:Uncharacterized protein n=1 Tax=Pinctada fucata TaxID=50426 RepID=A0A194AN69_PINFU
MANCFLVKMWITRNYAKKLFDNGKLTKGNCIDENTFKLCTERCKEFLKLNSSTKECPFGDAKRNCDKVIKKQKCQVTCSNLDTHEKEKYGKNCCGTCIRKCGYAPDPHHKKTYYQNLIAQGRK